MPPDSNRLLFTAKWVAGLKKATPPTTGERRWWDSGEGSQPGLCIVWRAGRRPKYELRLFKRVTLPDGTAKAVQERRALGLVADVKLADARHNAKAMRDAFARGDDAAVRTRQEKALAERVARDAAAKADRLAREGLGAMNATTVEAFIAQWPMDRRAKGLKPRTLRDYRAALEKVAVPAWQGRRIAALTTADVETLIASRAATPVYANRVRSALSAFFSWARRHGHYAGPNPVRDVQRFAERRREYVLTLADYTRLADALRRAETEGLPPRDRKANGRRSMAALTLADPYAAAALRVIAQTGMRLGEVLALRWAHVDARDPERPVLRLPDSKTGAKDVPIRADLLGILAALPKDANNAHVFPARRRSAKHAGPAPLNARTVRDLWERVRVAAALPPDRYGQPPRVHDLRHALAGVGLDRGHGLDQLGKALGHASPRTTARYAAIAENRRRDLLEDVSGAIAAAMGDPAPVAPAVVVPIKKARKKA